LIIRDFLLSLSQKYLSTYEFHHFAGMGCVNFEARLLIDVWVWVSSGLYSQKYISSLTKAQ